MPIDSLHEISIAAPTASVFDAWITAAGLCAWWTSDVEVPTRPGGNYVFGFDGGNVRFHFRIDEQKAPRTLLWTGVPGPGMPGEWIGTRIEVRLSDGEAGGTRMLFAHANWRSAEGAYRECNTTWGELMYRLRDHCEGRPRGPLFDG
jgi:uncharacterized protein YndB with AHSA1/START domain